MLLNPDPPTPRRAAVPTPPTTQTRRGLLRRRRTGCATPVVRTGDYHCADVMLQMR